MDKKKKENRTQFLETPPAEKDVDQRRQELGVRVLEEKLAPDVKRVVAVVGEHEPMYGAELGDAIDNGQQQRREK